MILTVNGETMELQDGGTVAQLLEKVAPGAPRVAVLVNDTVVRIEKRDSHVLGDGDRMEILAFAGGG